jgi:Alpha-L-arabinofuranosidase B, catalytic
MVMSLVVGAGLAATAVPARAAVSAPSSALSHSVRLADGLDLTVGTEPSGDFVTTLDAASLGLTVSTSALQAEVSQFQGENADLSVAIQRWFEKYSVGSQGLNTADWPVFTGTMSVTSDGTGVSIDIPSAEVQALAVPGWLATTLSLLGGALAGAIVTAGCAALLPAFTILCGSIGGFVGGFVGGVITQATANPPAWSLDAWGGTIAGAVLGAIPGGGIGATAQTFVRETLPNFFVQIGVWLKNLATTVWIKYLGGGAFLTAAGTFVVSFAQKFVSVLAELPNPSTAPASSLSCDVYAFYGTPCTAAYSMDRALYSYYDGPLYQVQRASDETTADIGLLSAGGDVNAAEQKTFCENTSCTVTKLYDQSPEWNDLTIGPAGGGAASAADKGADATALPITVGGNEAYGLDITPGTGYRDNSAVGTAVDGEPEGMYMVASGTNVNSGCCFDFGNAETNSQDNHAGHMDAVNLSTTCYFGPCTGSGPWVEADLEDGLFQGANGSNLANTGNSSNFVTAMLKNDGLTNYALKGGNAQSGGLSTWWEGALPTGYAPMHQEGAIILGTGGDNSNWDTGSFFEGVMTQGYPSDAADDAVQAGVVSAGYAGNSGGRALTAPDAAAGPAVVHDGYSSVYTVDSANGHLQESYLPAMGDSWATQDLTAKYETPAVMPGTKPVAVVHDGYTSVYTVDAGGDGVGTGDLQETYLPAMGDPWSTQDLSEEYEHTPPTNVTPTVVLHDGAVSVYTVDASNGHLQETWLTAMGDPWGTQDMYSVAGTPAVLAGTSPVSIVHDGYTSVYTVDGNHQLQETYLQATGDPWETQDLSVNYHTPPTSVTPTAVVHDGYTSVYTVDDGNSHLQETYLPAMGDPWQTQDLNTEGGTPAVAAGTAPVALFHTGYTSVYTVDQGSDHLQETYLPAIGDKWATQDLTVNYHTPQTVETPIPLVHPDTSGNLTFTSVYTIGEFDDHLEETYLPAIGDAWVTQDLTAKYTTPPVAATDSPTAGSSVDHDGYTSVYTVDAGGNGTSEGDLQETYLTAMGKPWATQDLSAIYHTPTVMADTTAVAVVHDGYTSVYTVDAGGDGTSEGDLQETYLTALGDSWSTQDLSQNYGTPTVSAGTSPAAVFHDGYVSVYTVDAASGDLQETYLPAMGDPWKTQDLSAIYHTPAVDTYTSPAAVLHDGYVSVYTVDDGSQDLQETYLPAMGDPWSTQDLSATYHTPIVDIYTSPAAVVHNGYVSVYTVDATSGGGDLQETFLPAMGDSWSTQDLTQNYGAPQVESGVAPVALYHTGYTSVYTVDYNNGDLQETYLPAMGDSWSTQDLTQNYHTPAPEQPPFALVHYDTSGGLTFTSLYTIDTGSGDLQETYLPTMGDSWVTQDLTKNYGAPAA